MSRVGNLSSIKSLPKIWVLYLLWRLQTDIEGLNVQLVLPREDTSQEFQFGKYPKPMFRRDAKHWFQRAFELGKNPDNFEWIEPRDESDDPKKFNLFQRVAEYVPYSEDWLFKPLMPYFAPTLPGIDYSVNLIYRCIERLNLHRVGNDAASYWEEKAPESLECVRSTSLEALSTDPEPIHLILLTALYHESQWREPGGRRAKLLEDACCKATSAFLNRPEFLCLNSPESVWCPVASALNRELHNAFAVLFQRIRRDGHRSPSPDPDGYVRSHPRCVFSLPRDHLAEADLCVGVSYSTPILHFVLGTPNFYMADIIPTKTEVAVAFDELVAACQIPPDRWKTYDRDTPAFSRQAPQKKESARSKEDKKNQSSEKTGQFVTSFGLILDDQRES